MKISTKIKVHFTKWIDSVDPPIYFTVSSLELYDDGVDLREHILWYHNSMVPLGTPEERR